jgi:glycosyltransferase involved in cell wall biosynthesis
MRLSFVLPKLYDHPIGGYKVHYQYANALAAVGHEVTLVHPTADRGRPRLTDWIFFAVAKLRARRKCGIPISWFSFEPTIRSVLIPALSSRHLPAADVTVLTAWQTAERTMDAAPQAGILAQIVYDYEFWMSDAKIRPRVEAALGRRDVRQIATSGVVAGMLQEIGVTPVATVSAGLQAGEFGVDEPIAERDWVIVFPCRMEVSKDVSTAIAAAKLILRDEPRVRIECFGQTPRSPLPRGMTSRGRISHSELRSLYNQASIFLLTSRYEGWGLPVAEAMACGAAVISTTCGGVEDFLESGRNGLLVPVGDPEAMAAAALGLLRDEATRVRLATAGAHDAAQMSVRRSTKQLERVLESLLDRQ